MPPIQELATRNTYDIRGNALTVTDALNRVAFRYRYDLADRPWRNDSIDAGLRRMVLNVIGNEIERRDSKGALILQAYDLLKRPSRVWARDDAGSPVTLRQRMGYGDGGIPDQPIAEREAMQNKNLLGQLHRHHDEAGLTTVAAVDFKGNVLDKSRRVIADAPILTVFEQAPTNAWQVTPFQVDWEPKPQQTVAERENELLETTAYQTTSNVDALNRVKRMQFPQDVEGKRRELRPVYNNAGGLEKVFLDDTLYVERIACDAKGQRVLIAYGNGIMTRYAYDPHTFRLKRLRSERHSRPDDITYHPVGESLQDFSYDYDLVGNILGIRDQTPESGIPNTVLGRDALNREFSYDPLYRLHSATGRETDFPPNPPWDDTPRSTDTSRARAYTEEYRYDAMGNILRLEHRNEPGGFTREFTVEVANNRLRHMQIGQAGYDYGFDANGNTLSETTSRHFEWNHSDQMKAFHTQTDGAEPSVHAHYLYDTGGQRVKKLVRKQGGQVEVTHYIDGEFEHHRWSSSGQAGENNHVHVMDDKQRIALVRLGPAHPDDRGPSVQFHLGDHLGSSNVVVDSDGALGNREEFTPYGETSFGSLERKRYRFTGMERDEESELSYHGARYYAPWLGRWPNGDPAGITGGGNLFAYAFDNPLMLVDPLGTQPVESPKGPTSRGQSSTGISVRPGETYIAALTREMADPLSDLNIEIEVGASIQQELDKLGPSREFNEPLGDDGCEPYQDGCPPSSLKEALGRGLNDGLVASAGNPRMPVAGPRPKPDSGGRMGAKPIKSGYGKDGGTRLSPTWSTQQRGYGTKDCVAATCARSLREGANDTDLRGKARGTTNADGVLARDGLNQDLVSKMDGLDMHQAARLFEANNKILGPRMKNFPTEAGDYAVVLYSNGFRKHMVYMRVTPRNGFYIDDPQMGVRWTGNAARAQLKQRHDIHQITDKKANADGQ